MNILLVHTLCRRVLHDRAFRRLIQEDPEAALAGMPFDEQELSSLLSGDVARLVRAGAHGFLLLILSRFEIFGLTLPIFNERIRAARPE